MSVEDIDHGWNLICEQLEEVDESTTRVGFIGAKAEELHESGDSENEMTVGAIGLVHEFGSSDGRVPERSFIRSTFDNHEDEIADLQKSLCFAVFDAKKINTRQALSILGMALVKRIRERIREGIPPPLSEATLDAKLDRKPPSDARRAEIHARAASGEVGHKGDPRPLIETGQMINALTHVVEMKGEGQGEG